MTLRELVKIILPVIILLVVLYFGIIGLLIADKANDQEELYFAEILVAIVVLTIAVLIVNRVNILQLIGSRNQIVIEHSPALYAIYDINNKTFKISQELSSIIQYHNSKVSFDEFLSIFNMEDQANIGSIISNDKSLPGIHKTGIIKLPFNNSEKFYCYTCKLIASEFNKKILGFWLIDHTDIINDEIELVELVRKYRVASFELGQIIDILPFGIWRMSAHNKLLFNNKKFDELKKLYNFDFVEEGGASQKTNFTKKLIKNGDIQVLGFNIIELLDQSGAVGYCYDRTELELTNRSIKTLENIFAKLIENISVGFLVLAHDLQIVNYNLAFINLFSLDSLMLAKKPNYRYILEQLKDSNLFPELKGFKEKHLQDIRQVKDCTTDLIHIPNGITIKLTIIPGKDSNTILTYENITPNLEVERQLTKTKLMFNSVVNMIEFPMVIISQNGLINFINNSFVETLLRNSFAMNVPDNLNDLMVESVLNISNDNINKLKGVVIECLESKNCNFHEFSVGSIKYKAHTIGLDDLSVILIIKKI